MYIHTVVEYYLLFIKKMLSFKDSNYKFLNWSNKRIGIEILQNNYCINIIAYKLFIAK